MIEEHAKSFPVPCMECGDRIEIELPEGAETGEAGTTLCRRGHLLLFRYDGVTVRALEVVYEGR
jgi:hypothetical protein